MMKQTKRPPNLGFRTLVVIYFQIILAIFHEFNLNFQERLLAFERWILFTNIRL